MCVTSHLHALLATGTQQRMETLAIGLLRYDFVLIFDYFCEPLTHERRVDSSQILYQNLRLLSQSLDDY